MYVQANMHVITGSWPFQQREHALDGQLLVTQLNPSSSQRPAKANANSALQHVGPGPSSVGLRAQHGVRNNKFNLQTLEELVFADLPSKLLTRLCMRRSGFGRSS